MAVAYPEFFRGGCLTQYAKDFNTYMLHFWLFDCLTVFLINTFLLIYKYALSISTKVWNLKIICWKRGVFKPPSTPLGTLLVIHHLVLKTLLFQSTRIYAQLLHCTLYPMRKNGLKSTSRKDDLRSFEGACKMFVILTIGFIDSSSSSAENHFKTCLTYNCSWTERDQLVNLNHNNWITSTFWHYLTIRCQFCQHFQSRFWAETEFWHLSSHLLTSKLKFNNII